MVAISIPKVDHDYRYANKNVFAHFFFYFNYQTETRRVYIKMFAP